MAKKNIYNCKRPDKSKGFYTKLGLLINPQFTNEKLRV